MIFYIKQLLLTYLPQDLSCPQQYDHSYIPNILSSDTPDSISSSVPLSSLTITKADKNVRDNIPFSLINEEFDDDLLSSD